MFGLKNILKDLKENFNIKNIFLSISSLIGIFLIFKLAFYSYDYIFNNFLQSIIIYSVGLIIILISLYYLNPSFRKTILTIYILISSVAIYTNTNSFLAYFILLFAIIYFIIDYEKCLDKFKSKNSLILSISFFLSLIPFYLFVNSNELIKSYDNYLNSQKFDIFLEKQVNFTIKELLPIIEKQLFGENLNLNINKDLNSITDKEFTETSKIKKEIIKQIDLINKSNLDENKKVELIKDLQKKLESIEKLEEINISESSNLIDFGALFEKQKDSLKKMIKSLYDDEFKAKIIMIVLLITLVPFMNGLLVIIASFLVLIMDFLANIIDKIIKNKKNKEESF